MENEIEPKTQSGNVGLARRFFVAPVAISTILMERRFAQLMGTKVKSLAGAHRVGEATVRLF
jgi:hypothetical protein